MAPWGHRMIQPNGLAEALGTGGAVRDKERDKEEESVRDPGGARAQISSANFKVFPK